MNSSNGIDMTLTMINCREHTAMKYCWLRFMDHERRHLIGKSVI